jgi:hypothetical protein
MRSRIGLALLVVAAAPAIAKAPPEEVARLHTILTPIGAERAGNPEGIIPNWTGGLTIAPACYQGAGHRWCDPFADDKPLFTITAQNEERFRDRLSAGQAEMLRKYPSTYHLDIYPTRRTAAYPEFIYEATLKNALNAEFLGVGDSIIRATAGVPFPIPHYGIEPIWNHKLRYRGPGLRRYNEEIAVTESGDFSVLRIREDARFAHSVRGATTESLNNVMAYFLQVTIGPPRFAGQMTLVHQTLDELKEPRRVWQYNPGQRRLHRSALFGYDNPAPGSEGLRTYDMVDTFNGPTDRYIWKLLGKREVFIPYNAYRIHSDRYKVRDIVHRAHLNQDLARYELHRVWVVEATLKHNLSHIYGRRVFYLDEDSWQIALADLYDRRGNLWRWQEAHTIQAYDQPFPLPVLETVYDLTSERYLAAALNNEDPETEIREFELTYFDPASVAKLTTR